jgi:membrane-bound ClpP family serine protease
MWVVAGVLLGLVMLGSLAGFHTGPHAHLAAGVAGAVVALWFIFMAVDGLSGPVLWALLGADLVVSAGVGLTAWKGWKSVSTMSGPGRHFSSLESEEGVAVSDLVPEGIVRVRGEQWSAASVNGTVRAGTRVQVLRAGVRLEVWGEEAEPEVGHGIFSLDRGQRRE